MSYNLQPAWYVLYVKSRQEKKVQTLLEEKGITTFLPLVKTIRKWSDRKKTLQLPLFTSYVFVKVYTRRSFNDVLSTEGACTYIRFGSEFAKVPESEIKAIKLITGSDDVVDLKSIDQTMRVGEIKTIYYGSLSGLECEVLRVDNNHKVLVRVNSLKQNITATIPSYYFSEELTFG